MEDNKKNALALGTEPVGKLLAQYALPSIVAMSASSLYNMIDSIFIGQGVGPLAISGLAITFPLMNLCAAFGAGIGVGASTVISVKLGQKDYKQAETVLGNDVTLNLIIGFVVGMIGLIFLDPILMFFGASKETLPYARDYMLVILGANVFSQLYFGMNAVLRALGKPNQAMGATIFTVVMNIILAPIFIWVFNWGIMGAAWATVIAQCMALCYQMRILSDKKEMLYLHKGVFKLHSSIAKKIISIGVSPFAMNACACLIVIIINRSLVKYGGDMAVGAYGIGNRIAFLFVMITMGINQGMQPIASYNFGAMQYDRLTKVLKLSIISATVVMTLGFILAMFIPKTLAGMFTTDDTLIDMGAKAMMIMMLVFPVVGLQMVSTNLFQCIGKVKISIFLSLSRQLIFLLPLLVILPPIFGIDGVWYSMPASDLLATVTTVWMLVRLMKSFKNNEQ